MVLIQKVFLFRLQVDRSPRPPDESLRFTLLSSSICLTVPWSLLRTLLFLVRDRFLLLLHLFWALLMHFCWPSYLSELLDCLFLVLSSAYLTFSIPRWSPSVSFLRFPSIGVVWSHGINLFRIDNDLCSDRGSWKTFLYMVQFLNS